MKWPTAVGLDAACVALFVSIGARNHHSGGGVPGVAGIGVPFWIALAAAWMIPHVRRGPLSTRSLATVWRTTVGIGVTLRNVVFGDGTAPVFILVTAAFLGASMAGWRALARRKLAATHR